MCARTAEKQMQMQLGLYTSTLSTVCVHTHTLARELHSYSRLHQQQVIRFDVCMNDAQRMQMVDYVQ